MEIKIVTKTGHVISLPDHTSEHFEDLKESMRCCKTIEFSGLVINGENIAFVCNENVQFSGS